MNSQIEMNQCLRYIHEQEHNEINRLINSCTGELEGAIATLLKSEHFKNIFENKLGTLRCNLWSNSLCKLTIISYHRARN